jgi:hypothetical protein
LDIFFMKCDRLRAKEFAYDSYIDKRLSKKALSRVDL